MSKEEPNNIFETAARMLGSKKTKKKRSFPTEGESSSQKKAVNDTPIPESSEIVQLFDRDIAAALEKMRSYHFELEEKIAQAFTDAGTSPSQIIDYLKNPRNFTDRNWKFMQECRREEYLKLWNAATPKEKKGLLKQSKRKSKGQITKKLGLARKKNWIPVK